MTGKDASGQKLTGVAVIRQAVAQAPAGPGVYRMLDRDGVVLYVGKAKRLSRRLAAYTRLTGLPVRLQRMVQRTAEVVFVSTASEAEALLLEASLIKRYAPPFNIVLRDDKSFPSILIRTDHPYPQILKHRGARKAKGHYFGPYASAGAVNRTLVALQKAFLLRSCSDAEFAARTRPCLLYQIKRCAAPCVGKITQEDYHDLVEEAHRFLSGRSRGLEARIRRDMEAAAERLDFERAAMLRDRLRALALIHGTPEMMQIPIADADVFAIAQQAGTHAVQLFLLRGGQHRGSAVFFPRAEASASASRVLAAFLLQFYQSHPVPPRVLVNVEIPAPDPLIAALERLADGRVRLHRPQRGKLHGLVTAAERNAEQALARRLSEREATRTQLAALAERFDLPAAPNRIEIYDNSHLMGREPYGVMVVATPEGFDKRAYRRFRITDETITPGDDYAMMRAVMRRRFRSDGRRQARERPDLLLIDGGAGQVAAVVEALAEQGLADIPVIGIAKGPDRRAGRETFHLPDGRSLTLDARDPVLFFLQRLRDEAHRFAITGHRAARLKAQRRSLLDAIPGVGPKRKRALITHFGSARGVEGASIAEIAAVPGISRALARRIWEHLHEAG